MRPLVAQLVALAQIVLDEIDSLVVVLIVQVHNRPSLDCDHLTFVSYHLGFQWWNNVAQVRNGIRKHRLLHFSINQNPRKFSRVVQSECRTG